MQRKHKRSLPPKGNPRYESNWRLWRLVNGAVADAFKMHPEYLAPGKAINARESICKRVVGALCATELRRETGAGLSGKTGG